MSLDGITCPTVLDMLDLFLPNVAPADLHTPQQVTNLREYEEKIKAMRLKGDASGSVVAFDVERRFNAAFPATIYIDKLPCLTTKNRDIFFLSLWDINLPQMIGLYIDT